MFRFSVDAATAERANKKQLASNNITLDEDWEKSLADEGDERADERCFRAETSSPKSIEDAVSFVRGHFRSAPTRVWMGDELYELAEEESESVEESS